MKLNYIDLVDALGKQVRFVLRGNINKDERDFMNGFKKGELHIFYCNINGLPYFKELTLLLNKYFKIHEPNAVVHERPEADFYFIEKSKMKNKVGFFKEWLLNETKKK